MIKFDGLIITVEPDYKDRIEKGIEIEELNCNAYDENDTAFKNSLLEFTLMPGKDFDEETEADIEKAVKRTVSMDWATIQLERANVQLERTKELFHNAVVYIKEVTDPQEYEKVFKDVIGMIDEEIDASLDELAEKQSQRMGLS